MLRGAQLATVLMKLSAQRRACATMAWALRERSRQPLISERAVVHLTAPLSDSSVHRRNPRAAAYLISVSASERDRGDERLLISRLNILMTVVVVPLWRNRAPGTGVVRSSLQLCVHRGARACADWRTTRWREYEYAYVQSWLHVPICSH